MQESQTACSRWWSTHKSGSHGEETAGGVQVPDCGNRLGSDTLPGVKFSEEREGHNSGTEFQTEEPMRYGQMVGAGHSMKTLLLEQNLPPSPRPGLTISQVTGLWEA